MTRRIPVVVLVLVLLGAVPATAQTTQQLRLKGLTEVFVLIESGNLTDPSASCEITLTGLTTAASKALLDNGIRVDDDARSILYVIVQTIYLENVGGTKIGCVSHAGIQLYGFLNATPHHSAQPVFGQFILASSTDMISSPRVGHGQRIRDTVFEMVEEIAVDIRLANQ